MLRCWSQSWLSLSERQGTQPWHSTVVCNTHSFVQLGTVLSLATVSSLAVTTLRWTAEVECSCYKVIHQQCACDRAPCRMMSSYRKCWIRTLHSPLFSFSPPMEPIPTAHGCVWEGSVWPQPFSTTTWHHLGICCVGQLSVDQSL